MPELAREVGALERPGQAAQALMSMDMDAAWRSMLQPQELTPQERDQFLKKLGVDKEPYGRVFRMLTNPALILALVFSHKFPVPTAQNMFKLSERVGSLTSRFPILGRLASPQALFRGTDVPDTFNKIASDLQDFRSLHGVEFGKALAKFEKQVGRGPTAREQVMVSAWMDGLHQGLRGYQGHKGLVRIGSGSTTKSLPGVGALIPDLEAHMSAPLRDLAQDVRKVLDAQFDQVFRDVPGRKRLLKALAAQRRAGFADETSAAMEAFIRDPKKIAWYWPHRIIQTEEDFRRMVQIMTESASSKRYAKSAVRKAGAWASPETYKRQFQMVPNSEDLALLGDIVNKTEKAKLDAIIKARVVHKARVDGGLGLGALQRLESMPLEKILKEYPTTLQASEANAFARVLAEHTPRSYSLKMTPVMSSYTHTLAGTYAWTIKGGGEKVTATLDELKELGRLGQARAKARADMIENTYIPMAMGRGTFRQALKAQTWEQGMLQMSAYLDNPQWKKVLGEPLTKMLQDGVRSSHGGFSLGNLSRKMAGWFYLSTLGVNPGSALKNTLQLVLTTGPSIGYRTTALGLERAYKKSHKYFALRLGPRRLTHEAALREAYPDFAKAGLVAAPITEEVVQNSLRNAYDVAALPAAGVRLGDKIQRAMMAMFTASETTVRLATFEGGLLHASRTGVTGDAAIHFAKKLVEQTQFLTGPMNTPHFLIDRNPLIRQLTQFPMRMLEFSTSAALTMGSGEKAGLLGLNPGTFARMIAGSVIALELGDAIGVNAGDALLGGAMPTFTPLGKVGAPLPFVPPALQILGAGAAGIATGDFQELVRSSPLLVPGGVAAAKVAGLLPPEVPGAQIGHAAAQFLERNYADYTAPAPDGRIAVFTGKGTLKGYYTPWELIKYGLGVRGGDMQAEQDLMRTLVKQRDQIREARVNYLDARFKNDAGAASSVAYDFKQRFGFDIPVSEKDVEAAQLRRQVSRLEQVVRTMPAGPARDQMVQLIAETLGNRGQSLLGIDPALLGAGTRERQQAREAARSGGAFGQTTNRFRARTDLGPTDSVTPQKIGRQPGISTAQPPF